MKKDSIKLNSLIDSFIFTGDHSAFVGKEIGYCCLTAEEFYPNITINNSGNYDLPGIGE